MVLFFMYRELLLDEGSGHGQKRLTSRLRGAVRQGIAAVKNEKKPENREFAICGVFFLRGIR